jgi:hypothetical protein
VLAVARAAVLALVQSKKSLKYSPAL